MTIGGLEWTGRLKFDLTPHSSMTAESLNNVLTEILSNSRFSVGEIDGKPYGLPGEAGACDSERRREKRGPTDQATE